MSDERITDEMMDAGVKAQLTRDLAHYPSYWAAIKAKVRYIYTAMRALEPSPIQDREVVERVDALEQALQRVDTNIRSTMDLLSSGNVTDLKIGCILFAAELARADISAVLAPMERRADAAMSTLVEPK